MLNLNEERLQKLLARAGIASRRACEDLIAQGRVKVNGKIVTELGRKIDPNRDKVTVDEEPINVKPSAAPAKIYLMVNKPMGYLSTVSDPQGRPTVLDLLGENKDRLGRLYPVGRLDADSEGLLLLTNDGSFANALTHPRYEVEKEYVALLDGIVAMKKLEKLRKGVPIPVEDPETGEIVEQTTRPARVELIRHEGSNSMVRFVLKEGKKRQVRLMAEVIEHPVLELKRVRMGPLKLSDLGSGKYRSLTAEEVKELLKVTRPAPERPAPEVKPGLRARTAPASPEEARSPRRSGPKPAEGPARPGRRSSGPAEEAPRRNGPAPTRRFGQTETEEEGSRPPRRSGPAPTRRSAPSSEETSPRRSGPAPTRRSAPAEEEGSRPPRRSGPRQFDPTGFDSEGRSTRSGPPRRFERSGSTEDGVGRSPARPSRPGPARPSRTNSGPSRSGKPNNTRKG